MTISTEISTAGPFFGNNVTTVFSYDFKIVDQDHVRVVLINALGEVSDLSLDDGDYSVTGVGSEDGGTIVKASPLLTGQVLTIVRDPPLTQETSLANQGPYNADVVEARLDLVVMQIQKVAEAGARSLQVEPGQPLPDMSLIAAAEGFAESAESSKNTALAAADVAVANSLLAKAKALLSKLYAQQFEDVAVETGANSYLRSEEFDNAAWTKANVTVTANAITAPDGTLTMDKVAENAVAGGTFALSQAVTPVVAGQWVTRSIWVVKAERRILRIRLATNLGFLGDTFFDANAGVWFSTLNNPSFKREFEDWGNGLYRVSFSALLPVGATSISAGDFYICDDAGVVAHDGVAGSGLYLWGAQTNLNTDQLRPYVKTVAAADSVSWYSAFHWARKALTNTVATVGAAINGAPALTGANVADADKVGVYDASAGGLVSVTIAELINATFKTARTIGNARFAGTTFGLIYSTFRATIDATLTAARTWTFPDRDIKVGRELVYSQGLAALGVSAIDIAIPTSGAIPSKVTVLFSGASTNGTALSLLRFRVAAGLVTSGYNGAVLAPNAGSSSSGALMTDGIRWSTSAQQATNAFHTAYIFEHMGGNRWLIYTVGSGSDSTYSIQGSVSIALADVATGINVYTGNASQQFDAGAMSVYFEY